MAISLYPHNREAYEAAVSMLNETGKAAVIHPTGTGKSFIGFKYCEDHPGQRVCWLSPSEYIFRTQLENLRRAASPAPAAPSSLNSELSSLNFKNIVFLTYARLMQMSEDERSAIAPYVIILDEFHRAGARQWGLGVQKLLQQYPEARLLGLTATNIRYLDGQPLQRFYACNSFVGRGEADDNALFADFVRSHPDLVEIGIPWNQAITDLTPVLELEHLEQLRVSRDMKEALGSLEGQSYGFRLEIEG